MKLGAAQLYIPEVNDEVDEHVRFVQRLFVELTSRNVTFLLLEQPDWLETLVSGDVDIWVSAHDIEIYDEVVRTCAAANNLTVIIPPTSPRTTFVECKYYLVSRTAPFRVLQLDSWTNIHWRSLSFITVDNAPGWNSLVEADSTLAPVVITSGISVLKRVLHNQPVPLKYREQLLHALNSDKEMFLEAITPSFGHDSAQQICKLIMDGKWDLLAESTGFWRRSLLVEAIKRRPWQQLKNTIRYGINIIQLFAKRNGLMVVMFGPDGAGKSTVGRMVIESNIVSELFQDRTYYHSKFPVLPPLSRIVGLFSRQKSPRIEDRPAREMREKSLLQSLIFPVYYGINNLFGHVILRRKQSRGGGFVLFDRYYHEYLVQKEFNNAPRWLIKMISKCIPRPDIVFLLKNSPETIYRRKQELEIDEIERQLDAYERVVEELPNSVIIETDVEASQVAEIMLSNILTTLSQK